MNRIQDSYGFLLGKALEKMTLRFDAALNAYQISSKHYGVLLVIHTTPGVSQKEVGDIQRIDRTTMVAMIDELETLGYVQRVRNPNDRRAYHLILTPAGLSVLERCLKLLEDIEMESLQPLSPEEAAQLKTMLQRLYDGC